MTSKKSFKNVYGYFSTILDVEKREDLMANFSSEERQAISNYKKRILSNAKRIYSGLSNSAKMAYKALNDDEQMLFLFMILDGKEPSFFLTMEQPQIIIEKRNTPKNEFIRKFRHLIYGYYSQLNEKS